MIIPILKRSSLNSAFGFHLSPGGLVERLYWFPRPPERERSKPPMAAGARFIPCQCRWPSGTGMKKGWGGTEKAWIVRSYGRDFNAFSSFDLPATWIGQPGQRPGSKSLRKVQRGRGTDRKLRRECWSSSRMRPLNGHSPICVPLSPPRRTSKQPTRNPPSRSGACRRLRQREAAWSYR